MFKVKLINYLFTFILMKEEIQALKERNKKVEADKAWETSFTRRTVIAVMTYIVVVIFLILIKIPSPFLNALVPTIGFILSTLTLTFIKNKWLSKIYGK